MRQTDIREKKRKRKMNGNKKHTKGNDGITNAKTLKYPLKFI
jgi:hypothetical protein